MLVRLVSCDRLAPLDVTVFMSVLPREGEGVEGPADIEYTVQDVYHHPFASDLNNEPKATVFLA